MICKYVTVVKFSVFVQIFMLQWSCDLERGLTDVVCIYLLFICNLFCTQCNSLCYQSVS